jgi:hypothetical protein
LANLEFFRRLHKLPGTTPVLLLGEGTFHQFHGGTATNVPTKDHPWDKMKAEYREIFGEEFLEASRQPVLLGTFRLRHKNLYVPPPD